jgi:hypothetical protein
MEYMSKVFFDIDDDFEFKIFRWKNVRCYLRVRNGTGRFRIYEKITNLQENKIKKFCYKNMKFKVYKKFLQAMKIDITIFSSKKLSFRKCDKILIKIISYLQIINANKKTEINEMKIMKSPSNLSFSYFFRILKHVIF